MCNTCLKQVHLIASTEIVGVSSTLMFHLVEINKEIENIRERDKKKRNKRNLSKNKNYLLFDQREI